MILWLDAQLPPALAPWLSRRFDVTATHVRELGLRDAADRTIFAAAREAKAVVLTNDSDFVTLVEHQGPPPQIVWLTIGNTSTAALRTILETTWPRVAPLLQAGEPLVEISGAS